MSDDRSSRSYSLRNSSMVGSGWSLVTVLPCVHGAREAHGYLDTFGYLKKGSIAHTGYFAIL
eukprot:4527949-Prymnesium_polylepis.1